jgi:hypothetical protein
MLCFTLPFMGLKEVLYLMRENGKMEELDAERGETMGIRCNGCVISHFFVGSGHGSSESIS